MLLNQENNTSCLVQLSMNNPKLNDPQNMRPGFIVNLCDVSHPNLSKPFQDITPRKLAVSGPRKVAAILSDNKRKIRLLETEVDPEDDDEEENETLDDSMMDVTPGTAANTSLT